jgi:hypothetical protein
MARLLDAASLVLAATRGLISVGEEILRERRDRLRSDDSEAVDSEHDAVVPRERIDLTY